jgi:hypothetical protein
MKAAAVFSGSFVEGPIVGQGYLNDPEKTAAAFINDPPWLLAGHKNLTTRVVFVTCEQPRRIIDESSGSLFRVVQVALSAASFSLDERTLKSSCVDSVSNWAKLRVS